MALSMKGISQKSDGNNCLVNQSELELCLNDLSASDFSQQLIELRSGSSQSQQPS